MILRLDFFELDELTPGFNPEQKINILYYEYSS